MEFNNRLYAVGKDSGPVHLDELDDDQLKAIPSSDTLVGLTNKLVVLTALSDGQFAVAFAHAVVGQPEAAGSFGNHAIAWLGRLWVATPDESGVDPAFALLRNSASTIVSHSRLTLTFRIALRAMLRWVSPA